MKAMPVSSLISISSGKRSFQKAWAYEDSGWYPDLRIPRWPLLLVRSAESLSTEPTCLTMGWVQNLIAGSFLASPTSSPLRLFWKFSANDQSTTALHFCPSGVYDGGTMKLDFSTVTAYLLWIATCKNNAKLGICLNKAAADRLPTHGMIYKSKHPLTERFFSFISFSRF
jgi:hypothetical protein